MTYLCSNNRIIILYLLWIDYVYEQNSDKNNFILFICPFILVGVLFAVPLLLLLIPYKGPVFIEVTCMHYRNNKTPKLSIRKLY